MISLWELKFLLEVILQSHKYWLKIYREKQRETQINLLTALKDRIAVSNSNKLFLYYY